MIPIVLPGNIQIAVGIFQGFMEKSPEVVWNPFPTGEQHQISALSQNNGALRYLIEGLERFTLGSMFLRNRPARNSQRRKCGDLLWHPESNTALAVFLLNAARSGSMQLSKSRFKR